MTNPITPPPRKDPQKRTRFQFARRQSAVAQGWGLPLPQPKERFMLQVCESCGHITYPAREACPKCLCMALVWRDVPTGGDW